MSATGWFTAHELAGLPGLPKSPSGAIRWLRANKVTVREVPGRGGPGGKRAEYLGAELPPEARAALAARAHNARTGAAPVDPIAAKSGAAEGAKLHLRESLAGRAIEAVRVDSLKASAALRGKRQQRMDAKLEILRARELFQQSGTLSVRASEYHFAAAYDRGEIQVADWIRTLVPKLSAASLKKWRRAVRTQGITALAGRFGNRRGDSKIDRQPQLRDFIIGMLVRTPHARATHVMKGITARFGSGQIEIPSLRRLEIWIADWRCENAQTITALANPDAWKNKFMAAFGSRSESIVRLNQLWEEDTTPGDVIFKDGRHQVLGGVDVYARRAKLLVSKTSTALAVAALNRKMLLDFGVPEVVKTDNGADYTSHHVTRVFTSLDIEQKLCTPFAAWEKPHVERFFRTFSHGLVELLDNYIGHNVAEREALRARQSFAERLMTRGETVEIDMTAAEFQVFCDNWIDAVYMHEPHEGLGGRTPFDAVAAWPHPVRRIADERALDVLLAPIAGGMRTVQKKGLHIDGAWFIAPELEAFIGQQVQPLELPDLGRVVVQGGPDLAFICIAECPERTGIDRKEVATVTKARQRARVQEARHALKAIAKKERTDEIVGEILADRARKAGKLAQFPKPTVVHDSAGLSAAADAVAELHRAPPTTAELMSDDRARAERARLEAEIPAGADNELARRRGRDETQPSFENTYERVLWTARQAKFRALTADETWFLAVYKKEHPVSYRGLMDMVDAQLASAKDIAPDEKTGAA